MTRETKYNSKRNGTTFKSDKFIKLVSNFNCLINFR